MNRSLITAILAAHLATQASTSSNWQRIPALDLPRSGLQFRLVENHLHMNWPDSLSLKIGEGRWRSLSGYSELGSDCEFSNKFRICTAEGPDYRTDAWILDMESNEPEQAVGLFAEAVGDALHAVCRFRPDVRNRDFIRSHRASPVVVTDDGVGVSVTDNKDAGLLFFYTTDSLLPDGTSMKVWRHSGYASCPRGCTGLPTHQEGPQDVALIGVRGKIVWVGEYLRDTRGNATNIPEFWTSDDHGRTWKRVPANNRPLSQEDRESPILADSGRPFAANCPTYWEGKTRLCITLDGGRTWDSSRHAPASIDKFLYQDDRLLAYDFLPDGFRIFTSGDLGTTWRLLRTERPSPLRTVEIFGPASTGGLAIVAEGRLRTMESPESPLVEAELPPTSNDLGLYHKIRLSSDAVYASLRPGPDYRLGVDKGLLRFRNGRWATIREGVDDFEVVSGRLFVSHVEKIFASPKAISQKVTLVRETAEGKWDTVLVHQFPSTPCEVGFKGGIYCPTGSIELRTDGQQGLQVRDSRADFFGLVTRDSGATWLVPAVPFPRRPWIDSSEVKIDSSLDLLILRKPTEPLRLLPKARTSVSLRGQFLHIELPDPIGVSVRLVSLDGKLLQEIPTRELQAGRHDIHLPRASAMQWIRVQIGGSTTTLKRTAL